MVFYKSCSGGNDFLLVDRAELCVPPSPALVRRWCDRHSGAGADGVIVYDRSLCPVFFRVFNQDGFEAELSGNGMAGLTTLLVTTLGVSEEMLELSSAFGHFRHQVLDCRDAWCRLQIDLGLPDFYNIRFFPFLAEASDSSRTEGYSYKGIRFFPVAIGNPQVVLFKSQEKSLDETLLLAEELHQQPIFPYRCNVSIVEEYETDWAKIHFFERGVGRTQSSSTGTAGAFAVLRTLHSGISSFSFIPPGGEPVRVSGHERIYVENCSQIVYKGEYMESGNE